MQRRNNVNLTEGSLWDKILRFALPLAATGILQQLFNAADIAVVGRFSGGQGEQAMAAVGANAPLIGLVLNSFIGISLGANVLVATSVGRRDRETVKRSAHTSVVFALCAGAAISVVCELLAEKIIATQSVPADVLPMAALYFRVYLLGMPIILLYNFEAAIFRGMGNTRTPLIALVISGSLNVVLNLFFVIVLKRTVDGVAAATVISNAVSAAILFASLLRLRTPKERRDKKIYFDFKVLLRIFRIGVPAGLQSAVFSFANIIIQTAVNSLGTAVMAASGAAYNVEIFAYFVLNSFSQSCTTFTGQNYGAGQISRCRKSLALCLAEGIAALGLSVAVILLLGRRILGIFSADPEVVEIGYLRLTVIFASYTFTLCYEVVAGYLRGFGISVTPAVLTMIGICGVRVTWIMTAFPANPKFGTIMTAYPLSLGATAALMVASALIIRPAAKSIPKESE